MRWYRFRSYIKLRECNQRKTSLGAVYQEPVIHISLTYKLCLIHQLHYQLPYDSLSILRFFNSSFSRKIHHPGSLAPGSHTSPNESQPDLHRIFTASIMNVMSVLLSEPPRKMLFFLKWSIYQLTTPPKLKKTTSMQRIHPKFTNLKHLNVQKKDTFLGIMLT